MGRFTTRSLIALGVVVALGLSTPAIAFAGSGITLSPQKVFHQELVAFLASRQAIQLTFQSAVSSARATFLSTLRETTSAAQRSAARQAMETAIIKAAAARSAALTALGNRPEKFSSRTSH
jgi:Kef-type K+ transport system membrane component KefB